MPSTVVWSRTLAARTSHRALATWAALLAVLAASGCQTLALPAPVAEPVPVTDTRALTEGERIEKVKRDVAGLEPILNDFWTAELDDLYGFSFVPPADVSAVDPAATLTCGTERFTNEENAVYCSPPGDSYVAYDLDWFQSFLVAHPGGATTFLIMAHEWGHAAQYSFEVEGGDTWFPEYRIELGADCLAGVFIGRGLESGVLLEDDDDMDAIFAWLSEQEGPWFEPTTHGTAAQRIAAFTDGYTTGDTHSCRMRY